jgi:histone acetyltransferase (RNA polymerase elongator complex component)
LIVPVFLPFQGCAHRCVYCDQEKITSQAAGTIHPRSVTHVLEQALRSPRFDSSEKHEVAFYGGTFTRLPKAKMRELLGAVAPYLKDGTVHSIRLSTRPDGLDKETLLLLQRWGVKTVELGAQSMDDEVLNLSQRGIRWAIRCAPSTSFGNKVSGSACSSCPACREIQGRNSLPGWIGSLR